MATSSPYITDIEVRPCDGPICAGEPVVAAERRGGHVAVRLARDGETAIGVAASRGVYADPASCEPADGDDSHE